MPEIILKLSPTLERCIETTARMEYNRLIADYLDKAVEDPEAEARLEMLHDFLESADFPRLRQESEFHLLRGEKVRFTITEKDGKLTCSMDIV